MQDAKRPIVIFNRVETAVDSVAGQEVGNPREVQPRAAIAAILFERLKDRLPVTRRALYRRSKDRASANAVNGEEIVRDWNE